MNIQIEVGQELFQFDSFSQWCDKARSWFKQRGANIHNTICVDTKGRICATGKEFGKARNEDAFPVRVFAIEVNDCVPS